MGTLEVHAYIATEWEVYEEASVSTMLTLLKIVLYPGTRRPCVCPFCMERWILQGQYCAFRDPCGVCTTRRRDDPASHGAP